MTLREMAEKAAETEPVDDCSVCDRYPDHTCVEHRADAIERVARAFAEKALRQMVPNHSERYFNHGDYELDGTYAEAIAAAEKGER